MATYTKLKLSGSTDGKGIKITQTATAGDTIHTAHATALDEIWIYAINTSVNTVLLTLEWGEAAVPDGNIPISLVGGKGLVQIIPGFLLTNSLVVKAFAETANVIIIHGYVNRIS